MLDDKTKRILIISLISLLISIDLYLAAVFLCSMADGFIQAYTAMHAREALKSIQPFERSNHVSKTIQLLRATAVTLDASKR